MYTLIGVIIFSLLLEQSRTETTVEYYENLINEKYLSALEYEYPSDAKRYEAENVEPKEYGTYDFVIIGAGSTGSVVANRLSEVKGWKVLVLEAGTYPDNFTMIPGMYAVNAFTDYNWGYLSTPQKNACLGTKDQKCILHRGRGIGGTSLINMLVYGRGNARDFDKWAYLMGDPSWRYDNVLPYFKKSENFHKNNPEAPVDCPYHGIGGNLEVNFRVPPYELTDVFLEANVELGYNVTDYNGKEQIGASVLQIDTKKGRRFDQGTAFILPASKRKNLDVLKESYVTKIEVDDVTKEATGVLFTRYNKTYRVQIEKEVILSAGAISSPQILLLSGIGPKQHLKELGIPLIQNLAVGYNLRDHVISGIRFSLNTSSSSTTLAEQIKEFLKSTGVLTSALGTDGVGWYKTNVEQITGYPDIELMFLSGESSEFGKKFFRWSDVTYEALYNTSADYPITFTPIVLHSHSAGTVRLATNNSFDYPLIDLNLLSDESDKDIDALYEGIQIVLKLSNTTAFQKVNATLAIEQLPACSETVFLSKDYWYCFIKQAAVPALHLTGTCSTGKDPEHGAVVNSDLKVFGVGKLRIADASVIPFTMSGHPNAACTMIGEKVSDVIKYEYGVLK